MPATDSPAVIVARFLKANHYTDTLDAFLKEAGLPPDAGSTEKGDLTIERILEEKRTFDLSLSFEKHGADDEKDWNAITAPSKPYQVTSLPSATNLLHVSVESFEHGESEGPRHMLLATTADRRLSLITPDSTLALFKSISNLQDSPILSCLPISNEYLTTISSGMSGQVILYNHEEEKVLDERRDHKKYVVKIDIWEDTQTTWVATAGWDAKIYLYGITQGGLQLGPPMASINLPTNPETIKFIQHPDDDRPVLIVTRRDSTSLYYYSISTSGNPSSTADHTELKLLGSQNLAPHSNAWIAFSPSSIAICPTDPSLLAVATSAVPHMKLIIVRLLIPPLFSISAGIADPTTQASQARANLAIQDREDAAIQVHVSTLAPQTPYSTPQVVWRPDGSGVWVNGDDGVLRGLEAKTGKVVATLKGGHEMGSKIRSIWCGMVGCDEWVVSGGFDRRLVVWRPETNG